MAQPAASSIATRRRRSSGPRVGELINSFVDQLASGGASHPPTPSVLTVGTSGALPTDLLPLGAWTTSPGSALLRSTPLPLRRGWRYVRRREAPWGATGAM
jgi:hypothetical protein